MPLCFIKHECLSCRPSSCTSLGMLPTPGRTMIQTNTAPVQCMLAALCSRSALLCCLHEPFVLSHTLKSNKDNNPCLLSSHGKHSCPQAVVSVAIVPTNASGVISGASATEGSQSLQCKSCSETHAAWARSAFTKTCSVLQQYDAVAAAEQLLHLIAGLEPH